MTIAAGRPRGLVSVIGCTGPANLNASQCRARPPFLNDCNPPPNSALLRTGQAIQSPSVTIGLPAKSPGLLNSVAGYSWWVAAVIDQVSRACVGFAVFSNVPSSAEVQRFLERAIRASGSAPRYVVSDKGKQFWCRSFKVWCKRRGIRPRYGRIGEPASIAIVERFIRSMKDECTRCLLVPMSLAGMRREIHLYTTWYNTQRTHMGLGGKTPQGVYEGRARRGQRFEPRPRWPHQPHRRKTGGDRFRLHVTYIEGRKHLPVIELRRAA